MATNYRCDRCGRDGLTGSEVGSIEVKPPKDAWWKGDLCFACCREFKMLYESHRPETSILEDMLEIGRLSGAIREAR